VEMLGANLKSDDKCLFLGGNTGGTNYQRNGYRVVITTKTSPDPFDHLIPFESIGLLFTDAPLWRSRGSSPRHVKVLAMMSLSWIPFHLSCDAGCM